MPYRAPLGAGVQNDSDDEEELPSFLSNLDERRWRGEQLNKIKAFMNTAVEREAELSQLLEWLTDTEESFRDFDKSKEDSAEVVSSLWIEEIERKLEKFMFDMDCGLSRLQVLCQQLFDIEVKTTKKETAALNKRGVWHWWREKKVDARTIGRIQALRPPSVESFVADVSLATKSSTELAFMLGDIAKALPCNKAMTMAFKFAQMGLENLNQAFQECSKEVKMLQAQVEEMMMTDCRFEMAQMKVQMDDDKVKIFKLEEELAATKDENGALLFQIHRMQVVPKIPPTFPLPPRPEITVKPRDEPEEPASIPNNQPAPMKLTLPKRRRRPKERPSEEQTDVPDEDTEDSLVIEHVVDEVEKKSSDLLQDFQKSVLSIIEKCMVSSGGKSLQLEGLDAEGGKLKAKDVMKLYCVLQRTIKDSFNGMATELEGKFTNYIIDIPPADDTMPESELWDSSKKSPGDMLKEISKDVKKHERTVKDAGANLQALFGLDDSKKGSNDRGAEKKRRHSLGYLLDQFQSISAMGKKQVCKMRMTLESLVEMHGKMVGNEKPKTGGEKAPLPPPPPVHIHIPSALEEIPEDDLEPEEFEVVEEQIVRKRSILVHKPQKLDPVNVTMKPVSQKDCVERYAKEMAVAGERIIQTRMAGVKHIVDVESQRANLKLLRQAVVNGSISPELYSLAKDLIIQTLDSVEMRLACLFRWYTKCLALQQVRRTLDARLRLARDMKNGQAIKDLYFYLQKLDVIRPVALNRWHAKQAAIDRTRRTCIAHMLYLFRQLRVDYSLHLAAPYPCHVLQENVPRPFLPGVPRKLQWSLNPTYLRPPPTATQSLLPLPPLPEHRQPNRVREMAQGGMQQSLWQVDKTLHSMWLARKVPAQTSHYTGSIPRLLEMDINQNRLSVMHALQARMNGVLDKIFLGRGDVVKNHK